MQYQDQLDRIEQLVQKIANHFYRLEFFQALQQLPQLIEASTKIIEIHQLNNPETNQVKEFLSFLDIVYTAMYKKDYILLADLLMYEWMNHLTLLQDQHA